MTDFYEEMKAMAADLLAPTSEGGLGQGNIVLSRLVDGAPPANPWDPVDKVPKSETLRGAASGVKSEMIGMEVGGTVILATDIQLTCAVPEMGYEAGDTLSIDGKVFHILSVQNIPAAGIASAVRFIVRG